MIQRMVTSFSISVRGVICMPTSETIKTEIVSALGAQGISEKVSSLSKSWVLLLIAFPITIVLSFVFMILVRFTAGFFIYLLIFFSIGALVAIGIFLIASNPSSDNSVAAYAIRQSRIFMIIIGAISLILAALISIAFCCFRSRIKLASSIVKVSA